MALWATGGGQTAAQRGATYRAASVGQLPGEGFPAHPSGPVAKLLNRTELCVLRS